MEPLQLLKGMNGGLAAFGKESPKVMAAFNRMDGAAYAAGQLTTKHKELIALGIAVATVCSYCISFHVQRCIEAGATREEILEAAGVGVAFGGSPALAHVGAVLMPALDEFDE